MKTARMPNVTFFIVLLSLLFLGVQTTPQQTKRV
jgi:hypothetical protein